jgi:hypothetical protein
VTAEQRIQARAALPTYVANHGCRALGAHDHELGDGGDTQTADPVPQGGR